MIVYTQNGYNQCYGGISTNGYKYTQEAKLQMSISRKGRHSGEKNPFYGKRHSIEQRQKWSKERKGRKLTEEWKQNISLSSGRKVKVINVDTGEIFNSIKEASDKYRINSTHISRVCKGKRRTTGGYHWEYYSE